MLGLFGEVYRALLDELSRMWLCGGKLGLFEVIIGLFGMNTRVFRGVAACLGVFIVFAGLFGTLGFL